MSSKRLSIVAFSVEMMPCWMYTRKFNRAIEQLAEGQVSETAAFGYIAAWAVLSTMGAVSINEKYLPMDLTLAVVVFLGTAYCFRANGGANGHDFLYSYVCLGWIVLIRLLPLFFSTMMATIILEDVVTGSTSDYMTLPEFAVTILLQGIFYWRLGYHIRSIGTPAREQRIAL